MDLRRRQIKRYGLTLTILVAAYLSYAAIAAPWIEGPRRIASPHHGSNEFDPYQFKKDLVAWLPEDAWERQLCKQISTPTGHIFFQEYQPHEDGRVEVRPLTIILRRADSPSGEPPIILRAPEGAILKLDRALSLGGAPMQMESGQLLGKVTLYRAATQADAGDEWLIETSEIQLSKQRIQTIQAVDFRFGPHVGRGRNLMIEFETDALRAQQSSMTGIRGARRAELSHLDHLHLVPKSNTENVAGREQAANDNAFSGGFDVSCDGPIEFDLTSNIATLSENVKVVSSNQANDFLTADRVELQLGNGPADAPSSETDQAADESKKNQQMSLQSIAAIGQPAVLQSGSQQLLVRGERLVYSPEQQTVSVVGGRGVEIQQANLQLTAADASYQMTDDGSLGLGHLTGPGVVHRDAFEEMPPIDIRWRDQLTITADGDQKKISLLGNAQFGLDDQSSLAADELHVWILELPSPEQNNSLKASSRTSSSAWSWHPDRLFASGGVELKSEQMTGIFDTLEAQWPTPEPTEAAASAPPQNVRAAAQPPSPQNQAANADQATLAASPQPEPKSKIKISGNAATAQMQNGAVGAFRDVVIEGNVHVQQRTAGDQPALAITGQRLQIVPQDERRFRLSVSGTSEVPTRAQAQQFQLIGPVLQLDQRANRLWIDGPGQLRAEQIAPRAETKPPTSEVADANAAQSDPMTIVVNWSGGLVFDGQQIYLESDVVATCDQSTETGINHVESRSAAINLSLTSSIDLSGAPSTTQPTEPQIELLTLIGTVPDAKRVFKSDESVDSAQTVQLTRQSFDLNRQPASKQILSVPWGQLNAVSGQLNMSGPGSVSMWQLSAPFESRSEAPAENRAAATQLSNTHVLFETSLTGNLRQGELLFDGKIRTMHGPVENWEFSLDPDRPATGPDCFRLRSEKLQVTQWQRAAADTAHVEIIAFEQAQLEGATFEALAERIGYNQSQEKVILEGDPRNGAQLTYQTTPGGPRNPLVASKIAFNLRDYTTQVEGFKHGVLTSGPIMRRK